MVSPLVFRTRLPLSFYATFATLQWTFAREYNALPDIEAPFRFRRPSVTVGELIKHNS